MFISTNPCDSNLFSIEHTSVEFKGLLETFLNLTEICKYPQSNAIKKFYTAHVTHLSNTVYIYIEIYIYIYIYRLKNVSSSVLHQKEFGVSIWVGRKCLWVSGDYNRTDNSIDFIIGTRELPQNIETTHLSPVHLSWFITEMHCTISPLYPLIIMIIIIITTEHVISHKYQFVMYKCSNIINSIFTHLTHIHNFPSYLRVSLLPLLLMFTVT